MKNSPRIPCWPNKYVFFACLLILAAPQFVGSGGLAPPTVGVWQQVDAAESGQSVRFAQSGWSARAAKVLVKNGIKYASKAYRKASADFLVATGEATLAWAKSVRRSVAEGVRQTEQLAEEV